MQNRKGKVSRAERRKKNGNKSIDLHRSINFDIMWTEKKIKVEKINRHKH